MPQNSNICTQKSVRVTTLLKSVVTAFFDVIASFFGGRLQRYIKNAIPFKKKLSKATDKTLFFTFFPFLQKNTILL